MQRKRGPGDVGGAAADNDGGAAAILARLDDDAADAATQARGGLVARLYVADDQAEDLRGRALGNAHAAVAKQQARSKKFEVAGRHAPAPLQNQRASYAFFSRRCVCVAYMAGCGMLVGRSRRRRRRP